MLSGGGPQPCRANGARRDTAGEHEADFRFESHRQQSQSPDGIIDFINGL